jgi:hypothetical protein
MEKDPSVMFHLHALLKDTTDRGLTIEITTKVFSHLSSSSLAGISMILTRTYILETLVKMVLSNHHHRVNHDTYHGDPNPPENETGQATHLTDATLLHIFQLVSHATNVAHGAEICAKCDIVSAILCILKKPLAYDPPLLRYAVSTLWNIATHVRVVVLVYLCVRLYMHAMHHVAPHGNHAHGMMIRTERIGSIEYPERELETIPHAGLHTSRKDFVTGRYDDIRRHG